MGYTITTLIPNDIVIGIYKEIHRYSIVLLYKEICGRYKWDDRRNFYVFRTSMTYNYVAFQCRRYEERRWRLADDDFLGGTQIFRIVKYPDIMYTESLGTGILIPKNY